jgi:hypothetical protein
VTTTAQRNWPQQLIGRGSDSSIGHASVREFSAEGPELALPLDADPRLVVEPNVSVHHRPAVREAADRLEHTWIGLVAAQMERAAGCSVNWCPP